MGGPSLRGVHIYTYIHPMWGTGAQSGGPKERDRWFQHQGGFTCLKHELGKVTDGGQNRRVGSPSLRGVHIYTYVHPMWGTGGTKWWA